MNATHTLTPGRFPSLPSGWRRAASELALRGVSWGGASCQRAWGNLVHRRFGILMYHRIADAVPGLPSPTINVAPGRFARQLRELLDEGYVFWPLRRVLDWTARGEAIPPRVVVLTFDDGFRGVFEYAWPVLRQWQIPATIFLATAYLDSDRPFPFDAWGELFAARAPAVTWQPLTAEQCREMAASGLIELGAHTHGHADFRGRADEFRRDLQLNLNTLRESFGVEAATFAFPYGTPHLGFSGDELASVARELGAVCALTTGPQLVDPCDSPYAWGRFHVFPWDTAATIAAKLGGWYSWAPRLAHSGHRGWQPSPRGRAAAQLQTEASCKSAAPASRLPTTPISAGASSAAGAPGGQVTRPFAEAPPLVSVIVPTRNRAAWLREALASLLAQRTAGELQYELVVVDNGSTDATPDVVNQIATTAPCPVRYLFQPTRGDAPARNMGVAAAAGDWLAFFDDDQRAEPDWLLELVRAARQLHAPVVGGVVRLDLPSAQLPQLGPVLRQALREADLYPAVQPYRRQHLPGTGNALVARSVFETVGRFDESFVRGGSDCDFFSRVRAAGLALWYTPRATIWHRVPAGRLTNEYLRHDARSGGAEHASYFDYQRGGMAAVLAGAAGRLLQATVIHLPQLAACWLSGDEGGVRGQLTRLWRTEGYLRRSGEILRNVARPPRPGVGADAAGLRPRANGMQVLVSRNGGRRP